MVRLIGKFLFLLGVSAKRGPGCPLLTPWRDCKKAKGFLLASLTHIKYKF
jgi:hypothetical protein